jgi:hypothetical protein
MRVGASGECGDLFVAHVDPLEGAVSAQRIGEKPLRESPGKP